MRVKAERIRKYNMKLRSFNITMVILGCMISFVLLVTSSGATAYLNADHENMNQYMLFQKTITEFEVHSDALTREARSFAVTSELNYLNNYIDNTSNAMNRGAAIKSLYRYLDNDETLKYIKDASDAAEKLDKIESYAIVLVINANKLESYISNTEFESVKINISDKYISDDEKTELAKDLLFGDEYVKYEKILNQNISECFNTTSSELQEIQSKNESDMLLLFRYQQITNILLLLIIVIVVLITSYYIIYPVERFVGSIKRHEKIPVEGALEMQILAVNYNNMFDENVNKQNELSYEAEHDPLTGLSNRGVFDKINKSLNTNAAMLVIDADNFKIINDTYGHETGDRVLKSIAALLKKTFSDCDYICRIGGDEFAVVFNNVSEKQCDALKEHLKHLYKDLKGFDNTLPAFSLSIGIAYGNNKDNVSELYTNADSALYRAKKHGGSSYVFYN